MMMTIEDYTRALERAWTHALPGREVAERDAVLREWQRRLEAARRAAPRAVCGAGAGPMSTS
jgi:hypothetical protein